MTSERYALMTSSRRMQLSARASSLAGDAALLWRRSRDVIQPWSMTSDCSLTYVKDVRMCEMSHSVTLNDLEVTSSPPSKTFVCVKFHTL